MAVPPAPFFTGPAPKSADALAGMRIVVERGDILHDFAVEHGLEARMVAVPDQETALHELLAGKHDCALVARITALHLIEKHGWFGLVVGKRPLLAPEYCYASAKGQKALPAGRGETVLVVEDEVSILKMTRRTLERLGYQVLAANSPAKAIALAEEHTGTIHLLLTDVVMPEMNGRELATRLQGHRPGLKILFMSGYTANVIAHRGVLDEGVNFIQKPFSTRQLAFGVRAALED